MIGAAPNAVRYMLRLEHQLAGGCRILRAQLHAADSLAPLAALDSQLLQRAHSALVARAPRFHALPDPYLLLRQFLVEQRRMLGFDFERRALLQDIVVIAARPDAQLAPIELDDFGGQSAHERPVVADEEQGPGIVQHHVLEPGNGLDVQMIRRLIQ